MKSIFVEAKKKVKLADLDVDISRLPESIAIAYSIQYKDLAFELKKKLSKKHKITHFVQVLGCSKPKFSKTSAVLLITSGKFHAINLALETKLPIYIYSENKLDKISEEEINNLKGMRKAAYMNFLNSKRIGILVSTKPGQENLKKAIGTKKNLDKKGKRGYLFISNNINTSEFENFQLNSWLNTACPRMDMNSNKVINIDKIK